MKFLANENFPAPSIELLREAGFEIKSISEISSGISDIEVISIAKEENLIILTFDKDYGELIFKYGTPAPPSVVFFRFKGQSPTEAAELLVGLIKSEINLSNSFTVIEKENIRQRSY